MLGAELIGPAELAVTGLATIDQAEPGHLTFIRSATYADRWPGSRATATFVSRGIDLPAHPAAGRAVLVVPDAEAAIQDLIPAFSPPAPQYPAGVHPTAVVDGSARVAADAWIGPYSVVGPGTVVEEGAVLVAQVYLGAAARVGAGTVLHPGVRLLDRSEIGARCLLWPNVVVGADGFGFRPSADGQWLEKVPHIGRVVVEDDVEIGANTSIDRGKFGATRIGAGSKIDNHCQIAHNCVIGRSVIVCGMTGIAGSVSIHDGAVIAGHVGIADHVVIGAGAVVAAKAGVIADVPAGATVFGTPAGPHREQMRSFAALRRLPDALRRLEQLERMVLPLSAEEDR